MWSPATLLPDLLHGQMLYAIPFIHTKALVHTLFVFGVNVKVEVCGVSQLSSPEGGFGALVKSEQSILFSFHFCDSEVVLSSLFAFHYLMKQN